MACKILVHSISVLSLFDSGASRCFISSSFFALHSIPFVCIDDKWKISMENEVITTNRIYKVCTIELCDRKLEADVLVLHIGGYDVILSIN